MKLPTPEQAAAHPVLWAIYATRGEWEPDDVFWWLAENVVLPLFRGEERRVWVSMHPRAGKSLFLTILTALWWMGRRRNTQVMVLSYAEGLAKDFSTEARNYLADGRGAEPFGITCNPSAAPKAWFSLDARTLERAGTGQGGAYRVFGLDGAMTGKGFDLGIVDDLFRDEVEADNPLKRENAWKKFTSAFLKRGSPNASVLGVGTAWHHDDVRGRLMKEQKKALAEGRKWVPWKFVNLPAIAEKNDPMGRAPGTALTKRWPLPYLEAQRDGPGGPRQWQALYQGRPTPKEGATFSEAWLRRYRIEGDRMIVDGGELVIPLARFDRFATVDLAGSKSNRADYTSISTWGAAVEDRLLALFDVTRDRLAAPEIIATLLDVLQRERPRLFYMEDAGPQVNKVHRLQFAAQAGLMVDPEDTEQDLVLKRALEEGLPIKSVKPEKNKELHAESAAAVMKGGAILIPDDAPWVAEWVAELLQFPQGHDDQVDNLSYAVDVYLDLVRRQRRGKPPEVTPRAAPRGAHFPGAGFRPGRAPSRGVAGLRGPRG